MSPASRHPYRPHVRGRVSQRAAVAVAAGLFLSSTAAATIAPVTEAAVASNSITELQVTGQAGVPDDATAVVLNLAAVDPTAPGFITAYPCGHDLPTASTLNYQPGTVALANTTIVDIGANGRVCLYALSPVDIIADINGWFPADTDYVSRNPQRLLDTRTTTSPASGSITELQVTGQAGVPDDATAVVLNLAAVDPTAPGFITAYPCGHDLPTASTLNYQPGTVALANTTIVDIGANGRVCLYALSPVDIIADINGWFPADTDYVSRNPQRLLDTRTTTSPASGSITELQVTGQAGVPDDATAVVLNLAAVDPTAPGFITAYPCGHDLPTASTLNYQPGTVALANTTIVDIGANGRVCLYALSPVDIIADINGWFPADTDYVSRNPQRLLDTRTTTSPAAPQPPGTANARFVETFDGDSGLDRFRYGVYHRDAGSQEAGRAPMLSGQNNSTVEGTWTGDHDTNCGGPDTQRPLRSDFRQDTTGANGWKPYVDFHTDELVYVCKDHLMSSMGPVAAYSVVWFSPDMVFDDVTSVSFDVNLTDLGGRQWIKWGVVSDTLFNSTHHTGYDDTVAVPGFVVSDIGAADLDGLTGPDRTIATWSGEGTTSGKFGIGINGQRIGSANPTPNDKATRHPVSLVDNGNGTLTATVAGQSGTITGSFPPCPCRVVFYDHNYTPDKDITPIGHTWHWDNIIIR